MPTRPRRINTVARKGFAFEGMAELQNSLTELASQMAGTEIKQGLMRRVGIPIRNAARNNAPVLSGDLRKAIFASYGNTNTPDILIGVNYKGRSIGDPIAPHAHLVEFGHAGPKPAPPHPYMRPAIEANRELARKGIEETYREVIEKFSKK